MESKILDIVATTATTIGAAIAAMIMALKKLNWITFGKRKAARVEPVKQCHAHDDLNKKLNGVRDKQLVNIEILNQHTENHKENKEELSKIRDVLKIIGENIAVLKDRSDREYNNCIGK